MASALSPDWKLHTTAVNVTFAIYTIKDEQYAILFHESLQTFAGEYSYICFQARVLFPRFHLTEIEDTDWPSVMVL